MNLRHATTKDMERIASLHALSWSTAYRGIFPDDYLDQDVIEDRRSVWSDRLRVPPANQMVIVAEGDSGIEGFICAYGDQDPRWGSLIDNLHVTPDRKRSGIGTLLMREGALRLKERYPLSGVHLWALEENAPARRFYERLGGRNTETAEIEVLGGATAMSCRYAWPTPAALHQACDRLQAP